MSQPKDFWERVKQLERRSEALAAALEAMIRRESQATFPREVRPCRTCKISETYPSYPANQFAIKFLDTDFPMTDGNQSANSSTRSANYQTIARSIDGYYPEGTDALAFYAPGRGNYMRGRWFLMGGGQGLQYRRYARVTLAEKLTVNMGQCAGIITDQYGPGILNPATSVTLLNLKSGGSGYVFFGEYGDAGYADYHTDSTYVLRPLEC